MLGKPWDKLQSISLCSLRKRVCTKAEAVRLLCHSKNELEMAPLVTVLDKEPSNTLQNEVSLRVSAAVAKSVWFLPAVMSPFL